MNIHEILDGRTKADSDARAHRAFILSRDLLHASWVFSLGGRPDIGAAFLASAIPLALEMKRQHKNAQKRSVLPKRNR